MRLRDLPEDVNELSRVIMGAAIEVHRTIGPGLLESAYRDCLAHELRLRGVEVEVERPLALDYKGLVVPEAYRADLLVGNKVIVELKCASALAPEHEAQLLTYLSVSGCPLGMLFNFHAAKIRDGFLRRAL